MALPNETTGFTYGWSPNDFVQNFLAEGDDDRGGAKKGENEGALSILEGDVVCIGTDYREVKAYAAGDMTVPSIGVALSDAKNGEMVPVVCGPIIKGECAEEIDRGNHVGPDDGEIGLLRPYTPTGGGTLQGNIGIALQDGDEGDIIAVLLTGGPFSFIA